MALYLCGYEEKDRRRSGFIYLDPHLIQPAVPCYDVMKENSNLNFFPFLNSYHC